LIFYLFIISDHHSQCSSILIVTCTTYSNYRSITTATKTFFSLPIFVHRQKCGWSLFALLCFEVAKPSLIAKEYRLVILKSYEGGSVTLKCQL